MLTARVDYSHRSDIEFLPTSTQFTREDDVGLWNARMVYESADQNWKITLWGETFRTTNISLNHLTLLALPDTQVGALV